METEYTISLRVRKLRAVDSVAQFEALRESLLQWIARHADSGEITMMESGPPKETDEEMLDRLEREDAARP